MEGVGLPLVVRQGFALLTVKMDANALSPCPSETADSLNRSRCTGGGWDAGMQLSCISL